MLAMVSDLGYLQKRDFALCSRAGHSPESRFTMHILPLLVSLLACATNESPIATAPAPVPIVDEVTAPTVVTLGWPTVDVLLADEVMYRKVIGTQAKEWKYFEYGYFAKLKARRDSVISWAKSQPLDPKVIFIGVMHLSMNGGNGAQVRAQIAQAQAAALNIVLQEADGASIITVEQSGTDFRLTPETYGALTQAQVIEATGHQIPDADLKAMMTTDNQAATRLIVDHPELTVYCGEEWTLMFEAGFLMRGPTPSRARNAAIQQLIEQLNYLRSETILIRTLEYMRQNGAIKGVIVQGALHQQDIERVKDEYGIHLMSNGLNE